MKYLFKAMTEYELVVEADNEDAACDIANGTLFDQWEVTARPEAELVGPEEC
jgi:hypothetical protein